MIRPDLPIIEGDICIEGKYIFSVGKEERDFQAEHHRLQQKSRDERFLQCAYTCSNEPIPRDR